MSGNHQEFRFFELIFAQQLGVDLDETYSVDLIKLSVVALNSLPNGWELSFHDTDNGKLAFFYNTTDNTSEWTHPNQHLYSNMIANKRRELIRRGAVSVQKPETTQLTPPPPVNMIIQPTNSSDGTFTYTPHAKLESISTVEAVDNDVVDLNISVVTTELLHQHNLVKDHGLSRANSHGTIKHAPFLWTETDNFEESVSRMNSMEELMMEIFEDRFPPPMESTADSHHHSAVAVGEDNTKQFDIDSSESSLNNTQSDTLDKSGVSVSPLFASSQPFYVDPDPVIMEQHLTNGSSSPIDQSVHIQPKGSALDNSADNLATQSVELPLDSSVVNTSVISVDTSVEPRADSSSIEKGDAESVASDENDVMSGTMFGAVRDKFAELYAQVRRKTNAIISTSIITPAVSKLGKNLAIKARTKTEQTVTISESLAIGNSGLLVRPNDLSVVTTTPMIQQQLPVASTSPIRSMSPIYNAFTAITSKSPTSPTEHNKSDDVQHYADDGWMSPSAVTSNQSVSSMVRAATHIWGIPADSDYLMTIDEDTARVTQQVIESRQGTAGQVISMNELFGETDFERSLVSPSSSNHIHRGGLMSSMTTNMPADNHDYTFTLSRGHEDENENTPTELSGNTGDNMLASNNCSARDDDFSTRTAYIFDMDVEEALDIVMCAVEAWLTDCALETVSLEVTVAEDEQDALVTGNTAEDIPPLLHINSVDYSSLHLGDFADRSVDVFNTHSHMGSETNSFSYLNSPANQSPSNQWLTSRVASSQFSPQDSSVSSTANARGVKSASVFTFTSSRCWSRNDEDAASTLGVFTFQQQYEQYEQSNTQDVSPTSHSFFSISQDEEEQRAALSVFRFQHALLPDSQDDDCSAASSYYQSVDDSDNTAEYCDDDDSSLFEGDASDALIADLLDEMVHVVCEENSSIVGDVENNDEEEREDLEEAVAEIVAQLVVMVSENCAREMESTTPSVPPPRDSPILSPVWRDDSADSPVEHLMGFTSLGTKSISMDSCSPDLTASVSTAHHSESSASPIGDDRCVTPLTVITDHQSSEENHSSPPRQHSPLILVTPTHNAKNPVADSPSSSTSTPNHKSDMKALLHYLAMNVKKADVSVVDYLVRKTKKDTINSSPVEPKKVVVIQDYKQRGDVMSHFNDLFRPSTVEPVPPPLPAPAEVPSSSSAARRRITKTREADAAVTRQQKQTFQQHKHHSQSFGQIPSLNVTSRSVSTARSVSTTSILEANPPVVSTPTQAPQYVVENKYYTTHKKASRVKALLDEVVKLKLAMNVAESMLHSPSRRQSDADSSGCHKYTLTVRRDPIRMQWKLECDNLHVLKIIHKHYHGSSTSHSSNGHNNTAAALISQYDAATERYKLTHANANLKPILRRFHSHTGEVSLPSTAGSIHGAPPSVLRGEFSAHYSDSEGNAIPLQKDVKVYDAKAVKNRLLKDTNLADSRCNARTLGTLTTTTVSNNGSNNSSRRSSKSGNLLDSEVVISAPRRNSQLPPLQKSQQVT